MVHQDHHQLGMEGQTFRKARGPLILKSLTGAPFEHYKHLAKDVAWLSDSRNAEMLLEDMNKPENSGEDRQEHLLTALLRITSAAWENGDMEGVLLSMGHCVEEGF